MNPAYQISKLNERRAVTSPQMRCDITRLGLSWYIIVQNDNLFWHEQDTVHRLAMCKMVPDVHVL